MAYSADHNVGNVQKLHTDALYLRNNLVVNGDASADSILSNLSQAIENLKLNWKGIDAGYRIQEVTKVYNAMVSVRNALDQLSSDSARVASNYREIQNANGAGLETLSTIAVDFKTYMQDYSDSSEGVDINSAVETGKNLIDSTTNLLDTFQSQINAKYNEIMENWTLGTGRDAAQDAFNTFITNVDKYKEILADVSSNITKALQNYKF